MIIMNESKRVVRLAISGWRGMTDLTTFQQAMLDWVVEHGKPTEIITGGARGADAMGEAWALEHQVALRIMRPDWERHGKRAALLRNGDIVEACTHLLAFPHPKGSGTQDTVRKAMKSDKVVTVVQLK